jgi:hypothetical protein
MMRGGERVSRPHADHQYLEVDDGGGDAWLGDGTIPAGPDGEELMWSAGKSDSELRRLRAESVCMPIPGARMSEPREVTTPARAVVKGGMSFQRGAVPDSGAGLTLLTVEAARRWCGGSQRRWFSDAQGQRFETYGGELLDMLVMDEEGATETLISIPGSQEYGLGAGYVPGGGAHLLDAEGRKYPMYMGRGGTYKIDMHVLPLVPCT